MVVNLIYHKSITRGIINRTSFCLWEISTLLRIWLFFTIRFLDHGPKGDSIVSELYHMRCYILMRVLWIERLDYDNWFLTLYFSIYICLGLFKTVGFTKTRWKKSLEIEESQELFFMTTSFGLSKSRRWIGSVEVTMLLHDCDQIPPLPLLCVVPCWRDIHV